MAIRAQIAQSTSRRRSERVHLSLEVPNSHGHEAPSSVLVHNLSETGLLLEMAAPLKPGASLVVEVPEAGPVGAQVVWTSDRFVGCRFERPLSKAALSAALLLNPIERPSPASDETEEAGAAETFHERLIRLRQERGFTRAQLAARAGISTPSLWAWETGRTPPRRSNLRSLAAALELTEEDLLDRTDRVRNVATAGAASEPMVTAQGLAEAIHQAKNHIGRLAGTEPERVRITVEF